jgi:hypothetical protein
VNWFSWRLSIIGLSNCLKGTMSKCWASPLGGCDGGVSAEHIVSGGLFESKTVDVRGFRWCSGESKKIGISSLTKNILCRRHNSELSPLDSAAIYAFGVLRKAEQIHKERMKTPSQKYKRVDYSVNAEALERWLLKTLINISYGEHFFIGPNSTKEGLPSIDLVETVFGFRSFPAGNGLFVAAKVGQELDSVDHVGFSSIVNRDAHICGAGFSFRGLRMFLDLVPGGLHGSVGGIPGLRSDWQGIALMRPFRGVRFKLGRRVVQTITFKWSRKQV